MRLNKQNANLYRYARELFPAPRDFLEAVHQVGDASALVFDCPMPVTPLHEWHRIIIYFAQHPGGAVVAPPDKRPFPRWKVAGHSIVDVSVDGLIDLTRPVEGCGECASDVKPCPLHPRADRVMWPSACRFRGHIHNGRVHLES